MGISRRTLLKGLTTATAAAVVPRTARAEGEGAPTIREPRMGMLFDATLCIGCKACMVACREANDVPLPSDSTLWDAPTDLSANAKNVIQLFQGGPAAAGEAGEAGEEGSTDRSCFVKRQCLHCIDPACVSACMLGSLQKRGVGGAVTWEPDLCVGCRYCQIACPFDVPKFEWESSAPKIVKCELCNHRLEEGGQPACTEVCPREAVIYGEREALLTEAKRRIAAEPGKYNPKVYGEHDAGGTQVLYLAPHDIQFAELGLPDLGAMALPERVRGVQGVIYKGFVAPVALYGILGAVIFRNHRQRARGGAAAPDHHEGRAPGGADATTTQERQP